MSSAGNPFQAPAFVGEEKSLPEDTEFLVANDYLLCDREVRLPEICILTGATVNLIRQTARLSWHASWLQFVRIIVIMISILSLAAAPEFVKNLRTGFANRSEDQAFLLALGAAIIATLILSRSMRHQTKATWFVSSDIAGKYHRRQRRVAGGTSILAIWRFLSNPEVVSLMGDLVIIGILSLVITAYYSRIPRPGIVGRHESLNILSGFGRPFIEKVQAIIDRHNMNSTKNT